MEMKCRKVKEAVFNSALTLAVAFSLSLPGSVPVQAAEGGYSNYLPGTYGDFAMAVEPEGRLTLRNDIYYYNADDDESVRGGRVEAEAELTVVANLTTLLFKPDINIFGASYAFGVLVPIVHPDIETKTEILNRTFKNQDDTTGLGDIAWIPLVLYWSHGNLHTSFNEFIVSPTGDYDTDNDVNAGLNYWSFDTNFALTHLNPDTGREFSFNLGHIYNTKNDDTDYQTGQDLHLDVVFNQFFSETFAAGIQGYYLKQITGDSGDGAVLGDFKAESAGIGPALLWSTQIGQQNVTFIAKWLHEFHAENRFEGDHVMAGFVMEW
jgi:hypothetical protein